MEKSINDLLEGATNVYRTRDYIVKQEIEVLVNRHDNNAVVSHDTSFVERSFGIDSMRSCSALVRISTGNACQALCTIEST